MMFEKSLYDLIRGLRNHKGNEREYIQNSLRECRVEIRGQDMDLKATALLKLIYLEMFGHDMSWASFHVLEVMSSPKYLQKRVGYLGAVQSFRPDTEVLMLATNLLKKDLSSTSINTMSVPIVTIPHIITSSLAMSLVADLLPRLTHSSPVIRKKTIVTLYRLALVYPETLRSAWPKIKERLMDEGEDSSVTAAVVNVVCELGWRRPQDFLPLSPRLFELLVDSGNNWMAIKLIKLFATLTPLEPRLVKKLLPPLTSIIRITPAMSLLYECINGIIQGGILGSSDDAADGDDIATLCVSKLRGMIMIEGDPNLKFVALLAFNKIVLTHPILVAQQEDVIMECIDSPDISIRLRALDLVVGMVSSDNLMSVVSRLMKQLRNSSSKPVDVLHPTTIPIEPVAGSDDEALEASINADNGASKDLSLPDGYKVDAISRILQMCSGCNYGNLLDFDWYIHVLIQLVNDAPMPSVSSMDVETRIRISNDDVSLKIGEQIRNVAVKVKAIRPQATRAAEVILMSAAHGNASNVTAGSAALQPIAWIVGEYALYLASPEDSLSALLAITRPTTTAAGLVVYMQSALKIITLIVGNNQKSWTHARKSLVLLTIARIIHVLEPLTRHPELEVQERAAEFLELLKLAVECSSSREASSDSEGQDPPLLLTQAMPSLFIGMELNSVAFGAQKNVPLPPGLDLDQPINPFLSHILQTVDIAYYTDLEDDNMAVFYHKKSPGAEVPSLSKPAVNRLGGAEDEAVQSYQGAEQSYLDSDILARRRAERIERNKDDPFYIAPVKSDNGGATPIHNILQSNNGPGLDIDDIPILALDLGGNSPSVPLTPFTKPPFQVNKTRTGIQVATDETLDSGNSTASTPRNEELNTISQSRHHTSRKGKSLLQVDSSHISAFSLEDHGGKGEVDLERQKRDEEEMTRAVKEIERLRLEMQRARERVGVVQRETGVDFVKKRVGKKKKEILSNWDRQNKVDSGGDDVAAVNKQNRAKTVASDIEASNGLTQVEVVRPKEKKKKATLEAETGQV